MAQRDLTVRLRADVGSYRKAMADASKSTDQVARAGQALQNVGGSVASVGDNLTKKVTLPLALAGAAAVKAAGDFDSTFTQMQTLAGLGADEVDGLKDSVLGLAGETGKAPQELAEALYFLRSSGLDGAQAMEALEVSAKASAAGLGDTVVLADAVSSAMMAYSEAGLTAAEATDVLVATARAGKAEPSELAGQLGRLIPISAELGISFADVGGAVAALSTKGNDAATASTQLLGVMSKLLKPSQQAAEQLDEVGLSTDAIRQMIAEKGLLGTLEELQARLGDNGFIKFLEDQQAVQGGLALLGGDLNKTKDIFGQVNDAAGATEEAFATWAESMGAKNAQAFAQFQVALIRVGDTLAPIAADVLNAVASIAEAFSSLPDGAQKAIIAIGLIAAATGPLLSVGGRLVSTWGTLMKLWSGIQNWTAPTGTIAKAFNDIDASATRAEASTSRFARGMQVAGAVAGWLALAGAVGQVADAVDPLERADLSKLENSILRLGENGKVTGEVAKLFGEDLDDLGAALERITAPSIASQAETITNEISTLGGLLGRGVADDLDEAKAAIDDFDKALAQLARRDPEAAAASLEALTERMEAQGIPAEKLTGLLDDYDAALAEIDTAEATSGTEELGESMAGQAEATGEATSALQEYSDALKAQVDPIFAAMDAITGNKDAQVAYQDALIAVAEAQVALDDAIAQHGAKSDEAAEAQRNLTDAQRGVEAAQWATVTSAAEADAALADLSAAVEAGDVKFEDFRNTLDLWVAQGFITQGQADAAAWSVGGLAAAADDADSKRVEIPVGETGAPRTRAELWGVRDAALDAGRQRPTVHTATSGTNEARNRLWSVRDAVFSIPTSRTIDVTIRQGLQNIFGGLRAEGGPVRAGEAYVVGERHAELFIPDRDGMIFPDVPSGLMAAQAPGGWPGAAGGMGGSVTNIYVDRVVANDPQSLIDGLVRWSRNNGPLPVRVRG